MLTPDEKAAFDRSIERSNKRNNLAWCFIRAAVRFFNEAEKRGLDFRTEEKMLMTDGPVPEPTGGYELHLYVDPPKKVT